MHPAGAERMPASVCTVNDDLSVDYEWYEVR